ncbi:MAG: hypothetical protein U0736_01710 [Gemmataceae bacterium]
MLPPSRSLVDAILEEEPADVPSVPAGQRRLIVEEAVSELLARGELLHYNHVADTAGFASRLLGLIDELEQAGVTPDASPLDGLADARGRECGRLFARYRRELRRLGWHDERSREMTAVRGLLAARPAARRGRRRRPRRVQRLHPGADGAAGRHGESSAPSTSPCSTRRRTTAASCSPVLARPAPSSAPFFPPCPSSGCHRRRVRHGRRGWRTSPANCFGRCVGSHRPPMRPGWS